MGEKGREDLDLFDNTYMAYGNTLQMQRTQENTEEMLQVDLRVPP